MRCVNDLDIESSPERLHVGDNEIVSDYVSGRKYSTELRETKSSQDRHDIRIVTEIEVQFLIHWKGSRGTIKSPIDIRSRPVDCVMLKSSEEFLDPTDSDSTASGRLESVVASEGEVNRVFVALPFFVCEQAAEGRVSQSNGFICAETLSIVGIRHGPVVARDQRGDSGSCVLEINASPFGGSVIATR